MTKSRALRIRRSVIELQNDYDRGDKLPLENLVRAWRGIQALPATDHRSFFMLGASTASPSRTDRRWTRSRPPTPTPTGAAGATMATCWSRPGTASTC